MKDFGEYAETRGQHGKALRDTDLRDQRRHAAVPADAGEARPRARAPAAGCTVRDALELAAVKRLSDALGSSDANLAARQLGEVLVDIVPAGRLELVYDRQYKRLAAARDDTQLRALVSHGRPVTVLALEECFAEVSNASAGSSSSMADPNAIEPARAASASGRASRGGYPRDRQRGDGDA